MTYRYNKEDNTIRPVVEKPKRKFLNPNRNNFGDLVLGHYQCPYCGYTSSTSLDDMDHDCILSEYEKLKSTRIPVSGKHKWGDGYFVTEGVHFESVYQKNILFSDGYPAWKNISKEQYKNTTTLKRIIAIPIEVKEGKEVLPHLPKQSESFADYGKRMLGKEADQPDWKEKAERGIIWIISDHTVSDINKAQAIIQWIEDNKHLIK